MTTHLVEHEHPEVLTQSVDAVVGQVIIETAGRRDQDGRGRCLQLLHLRTDLRVVLCASQETGWRIGDGKH